MPDKHEVGGSSPLGPTKFSRRENLPLHSSLFTVKTDSRGDSPNRGNVATRQKGRALPKGAFPTVIELLKHLKRFKCFKNLMKN